MVSLSLTSRHAIHRLAGWRAGRMKPQFTGAVLREDHIHTTAPRTSWTTCFRRRPTKLGHVARPHSKSAKLPARNPHRGSPRTPCAVEPWSRSHNLRRQAVLDQKGLPVWTGWFDAKTPTTVDRHSGGIDRRERTPRMAVRNTLARQQRRSQPGCPFEHPGRHPRAMTPA
jgi:hypothetical protein